MSYKRIDSLDSYQIEPGDFVKNNYGEIVQVFKVVENNDGTVTVSYLDEYLDEELDFTIDDDFKFDLFVADDGE